MRDGTATRTRINQTALRLFVSKGVTETTIKDIAKGARVAEGAMYRHYASKEDLVRSLFSSNYAAFGQALDKLQARESGLQQKIRAMVHGFCELFDSDPVSFRFLLLVQHEQLDKLTPEMQSPVNVVRDVIAKAIRRKEIPRRDPEFLTAMVIGIVLQTATFKIYGRLAKPLFGLADDLVAACLRAIGGEEAAQQRPLRPRPLGTAGTFLAEYGK